MLRNEPPPGTSVRFTRSIREARQGDLATLDGPREKYYVDAPDDQFFVEFRGRRFLVERRDIEEG